MSYLTSMERLGIEEGLEEGNYDPNNRTTTI